ncbi:MAG: universal stress protein [Gammaproteobacteria bacterium]|nr:universal stress protein [Gammaproteobacteria bacterium]
MTSVENVLLASHGTEGSIAAAHMAVRMCNKGAKLHHLVVVPTLWKGMTGDDWLNNGSTRNTFRRYLEGQLGREIDEHCKEISEDAEQHSLHYTREIVVGEPEACLLSSCNNSNYDMVIMGSPRPKGKSGIRSRMPTEPLARSLSIPLLIVPYPNE